MAEIELQRVSKRFGEVEVLRDVSFRVGDGQIAALLGPSGCGKSTTLFLLAGLYQPSSGAVRFDGADMAGVHPKDRNVGLVFQSYALYPHLSVRGNIGFPLKLQGLRKAEIGRRVDEAAALVGLEGLLDRKPAQLSGGQQQRVAAARAIVKRPRLLLMDEPLSNLDMELRGRLRRELRRVQRETRITTIIVTHDQEEAMSLADRIYVMQGGTVQQDGDHRELYERPANRFVAGFIGMPPMNFAEGLEFLREDGEIWVSSDGRRLLAAREGGELSRCALEHAVLGVRPEHVTVSADPGRGVAAEVVDLVPEGRDQVVGLELEGGMELRSVVSATFRVELGQKVGVVIDEAYVHLFDRDRGDATHHGSHDREVVV